MKSLILDGSQANDPMSMRLNAAIQLNLEDRGWSSESIVLREKKIDNGEIHHLTYFHQKENEGENY